MLTLTPVRPSNRISTGTCFPPTVRPIHHCLPTGPVRPFRRCEESSRAALYFKRGHRSGSHDEGIHSASSRSSPAAERASAGRSPGNWWRRVAASATCDILEDNLAETKQLCEGEAVQGSTVSTAPVRRGRRGRGRRVSRRGQVGVRHRTTSTCCSTTPVSAAAAASSTRTVRNGSAPSTSAGSASTTARRAFMPMLVAKPPTRTWSTPAASTVSGRRSDPRAPTRPTSAAKFARERLHRSADHRLRQQRAPRQSVCRHARSHRHVDRRQRAQDHARRRDHRESPWPERAGATRRLGVIDSSASDEQVRQVIEGIGDWFRQSAPTTRGAGGVDHPRRRPARGAGASSSATTPTILDELVREAPEGCLHRSVP